MTIMTSREFNQRLNQAQRSAQTAPVIITNRGEPAYVLMSYAEYQKHLKPVQTIAQAFANYEYPEVADIELDIPPRTPARRPEVEL